eukprot:3498378-Rhodomonas_salina.1
MFASCLPLPNATRTALFQDAGCRVQHVLKQSLDTELGDGDGDEGDVDPSPEQHLSVSYQACIVVEMCSTHPVRTGPSPRHLAARPVLDCPAS